jgi:hypothetical protein
VSDVPIIVLWNETVARAARQIHRWLSSFEDSNYSQYWWLRKQVEAARKAEERSRDYPVFRFYNEALTARVTAGQDGALLDVPVPSLGQHAVRSLDQWNVIREVNDAKVSTTLLPDMIDTLAGIVSGLRSSAGRFQTPSRGMFDLGKLDASALPGLAGLTFKTIGQDRGAIKRRAEAVHGALEAGKPGDEAAAAAAPSAPIVVRLDSMGASLDDLTRYAVAGLLVIPTLVVLVPRVAADAQLALRYWVIDFAEGVEDSVYDLREDVLTTFAVDLPVAVEKAFVFVDAVRSYGLDMIRFSGQLTVAVLRGTFTGLHTFAEQLRAVWDQFAVLVGGLVKTGQAVVDLDIGETVHLALVAIDEAINAINPLLRSDPWDPPDQYSVTVGELVLNTGPGARAQRDLRAGMDGLWTAYHNLAFEDTQNKVIRKISGYDMKALITAVDTMVKALGHPQNVPAAVPKVAFDPSSVDNLGNRIVEPLRRGADALLDSVEREATFAVQGIATAAHGGLTSVADTFHAAAEDATRTRSLQLIQGVSGTDELLGKILGNQQAAPGDHRFDALAGQYAAWLVQGGFEAIGAVLAGYVGQMLDLWARELDANADTPFEVTKSSPRKLLERARLARVHTTRLRIAVRAGEMSRPLAMRVADTFQQAVSDAYATGERDFQNAAKAVAV